MLWRDQKVFLMLRFSLRSYHFASNILGYVMSRSIIILEKTSINCGKADPYNGNLVVV
jgi:hypothetical protein